MAQESKRNPRYVKSLLSHYKNSAAKRGIEFLISDETALKLFRGACAYCGFLSIVESNGIDRIDSAMPYVDGNVVSCCKFCNRAKWTFGVEEFRNWMNWVRGVNGFFQPGMQRSPESQGKPGRPKVYRVCGKCAIRLSTRELRNHTCADILHSEPKDPPSFYSPPNMHIAAHT